MNKKVESVEGSCVGAIVLVAALLAVLVNSTGCGAITGIKRLDAWGFVMDFSPGMDVHAGINGIDQVDDRRGIGGRRATRAEPASAPISEDDIY